ncbi:MAG TPA: AEC family transporter [Clostridia bacterium]|nr:AEC family transporter [Clostridia bacterium]
MQFSLTAITVVIMLAYAIPGYLLIKSKIINSNSISAFAVLLLYVCQPCLSLYSFQKVSYSSNLALNMLIFFALSATIQLFMLGGMFLIFRKKYSNPKYRVITLGSTFGNVGFLGVPLLEALLPQYPEAVTYSAVFIVSMNIICWTLGSALLTSDKKYISIKKLLVNPPLITLLVALPLFFTSTSIPHTIMNAITLLGKMTTPLCMIILGMRFATVKPKEVFFDGSIYFTSAIKLLIFPLIGYLLTHFLPIDYSMKATMFILCCCPTASVVLNLSEIYGHGQKYSANIVLASTIFSMFTIPLLLMIL